MVLMPVAAAPEEPVALVAGAEVGAHTASQELLAMLVAVVETVTQQVETQARVVAVVTQAALQVIGLLLAADRQEQTTKVQLLV